MFSREIFEIMVRFGIYFDQISKSLYFLYIRNNDYSCTLAMGYLDFGEMFGIFFKNIITLMRFGAFSHILYRNNNIIVAHMLRLFRDIYSHSRKFWKKCTI